MGRTHMEEENMNVKLVIFKVIVKIGCIPKSLD